MKEASISSDTLVLAAPRLSTMICSHFSQGGESRARLQFTFPVQVRILWKDWGSVMEPSTARTAHAFFSLVTQFRSSNRIPAACLGTKTLQEEGPAVSVLLLSTQANHDPPRSPGLSGKNWTALLGVVKILLEGNISKN